MNYDELIIKINNLIREYKSKDKNKLYLIDTLLKIKEN